MLLKRFFPLYVYNKVEEISFEMLEKENIKAIIFDMDNTLVDYTYKYDEKLKIWFNNLKERGIKFCILSNTYKKNNTKLIASSLNMKYINNAFKPLRGGFRKAIEILDVDKSNVAIAGDQIFTDIWGGNRFGIKTILIKPINSKEGFFTRIKRPLERYILRKYDQIKEGAQ